MFAYIHEGCFLALWLALTAEGSSYNGKANQADDEVARVRRVFGRFVMFEVERRYDAGSKAETG